MTKLLSKLKKSLFFGRLPSLLIFRSVFFVIISPTESTDGLLAWSVILFRFLAVCCLLSILEEEHWKFTASLSAWYYCELIVYGVIEPTSLLVSLDFASSNAVFSFCCSTSFNYFRIFNSLAILLAKFAPLPNVY